MTRIYITLFALLGAVSASAQTSYTWTGNGANNLWSNSANWSPAGVPGTNSGDNVTIGLKAKSPVLDQNRTIANLTFSQQTLDMNGFSVTANGTSALSSGLIKNGSFTTVNIATMSPGFIAQGAAANMLTLGSSQVATAFMANVTGAGYTGNICAAGASNGYLYLFPTLPTGTNTSVINIVITNPSNTNQFKTLRLVINNLNQIINTIIVDGGGSYAIPATFGGVHNNQTYVDLSPNFLTLLFGSCTSNPLQESQNYVRTQTLQVPHTDPTTVAALPVESMVQTTENLDGLGRPLQTVIKQFSPKKRDLVQVYELDAAGRTEKHYLPFVTEVCNGSYIDITTAKAQQQNFYTINSDPLIPKVVDPLLYNGTQNNSYSQVVYESSPMNRVLESSAPGEPWKLVKDFNGKSTGAGHTNKLNFRANTANEVLLWTYDDATGNASAASGSTPVYYAANSLYVQESMDENWNATTLTGGRTSQFTDLAGRLILKKERKDATTNFDTYYIYDDLGLLRYVVPPQPSSLMSGQTWAITPGSTFANTWLFSYQYDARHRVTSKKVPGANAVNMVYDLLDRPVITQDGNQAAANPKQWQFFKYDVLGRNIMNGVYTDNVATLDTLQTYFNTKLSPYENRSSATGNIFGYTNTITPIVSTANDVHTVNYYDDYDFNYNGTADYSYSNAGLGTSEPVPFSRTMGQLTGTKTSLLNSLNGKLTKAFFYDKYDRQIQVQGNNHLYLSVNTGSSVLPDITTTVYDWSGKVLSTKKVHTPGIASAITIKKQYTYDHMGRLLTLTQQNNTDAAVMLAKHVYNELGQEIEKNLHSENSGVTFLQSVDYRKNIRGWLTSINNGSLSNDAGLSNDEANDLFGISFLYESTNTNLLNTAQFSGNISAARWKTNNPSAPNPERAYTYLYDNINRLVDNKYLEKNSSWTELNKYTERSIQYDANGNIQQLTRYGGTTGVAIDILAYGYSSYNSSNQLLSNSSNQLTSMTDGGNSTLGFLKNGTGTTQYTYDANGNITGDSNKGILGMSYNYLNLLTTANTSATTKVDYFYNAKGTRFTKRAMLTNGTYASTHYVDEFIYDEGVLKLFHTEEGRAIPSTGGIFKYQYDLKDHLGNVRLSFDKGTNGNVQVVQEDHYYPFGYRHNNGPLSTISPSNNYLYNGKELQTETGLYDYGARMYDPALGRWNGVDPLAEKSRKWSPYNYCVDNPIRYVDPDGREVINIEGGVRFTGNDAKIAFTAIQQQEKDGGVKGIHLVSEAVTPNIYKHTLNSFRNGKPDVLHYDSNKENQAERRKEAMKGYPSRGSEGLQRDEYPYASTLEGGAGADIAYVLRKENSSQGGSLGALYNTLKSGDSFLVLPVPRDREPDAVREPSPVPSPFMRTMSEVTGLTGTGLLIYVIISEGTRLFPPRNLIPIP